MILQSLTEAYILLRVKEITKSMKQQNYIEDSLGKKITKKSQKVGQTANRVGCEISKFRNLRNSTGCEILQHYKTYALLLSPYVFSSNYLLSYTCSFEFGSGSLYLSRLDDNALIGLQNYKNNHKI